MMSCFALRGGLGPLRFGLVMLLSVSLQETDAFASPTMIRTPTPTAAPAPAPAPVAAPSMTRTPTAAAPGPLTPPPAAPPPVTRTPAVPPAAGAATAAPVATVATPATGAPPAAVTAAPASTEPKMIGLATDGVAVVRASTLTEKRAAALASEAMNTDFLNTDFAGAEKKLRRAVEMCLKRDSCSVPFLARLHRDIGVVYIVGLDRIEDGKDEFATALSADMTVAIVAETNTEAVEAAFMEVKRSILAEGEATPKRPGHRPAATRRRAHTSEFSAPAAGADAWRGVANWFSFGVQQDFMVHTSTENICNAGSRYRCFDAQNNLTDYSTLAPGVTVTKGNEISATGFKPGTTRMLLGYERLLSKNLSIGIKLGVIVAGKAQRYAADPALTLFHGEARLTLYPGSAPFAPTKVARPYLFASGGIAEVDSKIAVEVHVNNQPSNVLAWKRSGKGFVGAGFGLAFAFGKNHGPFLEARFMRMLEKPAFTAAAQAGYAVGF